MGVWFAMTVLALAQEVEVLDLIGGGQEPVLSDGTLVWSREDDGRVQVLFGGPLNTALTRLRSTPAGAVMTTDRDFWAWASRACQFVAPAVPTAWRSTIPAGTCPRSEIAVSIFSIPRRDPSVPVRVRCLTAPGARCRVKVRAFTLDGETVGRTRDTVPRGARRTLRVPIKARDAARFRRAAEHPIFDELRTIDPDGRVRRIGPI